MHSTTEKCLPRISFFWAFLFGASNMSTPAWVHRNTFVCMLTACHQVSLKISLLSKHTEQLKEPALVWTHWPLPYSCLATPRVNIHQHSCVHKQDTLASSLLNSSLTLWKAVVEFKQSTSRAHFDTCISLSFFEAPNRCVPTVCDFVNQLSAFLWQLAKPWDT